MSAGRWAALVAARLLRAAVAVLIVAAAAWCMVEAAPGPTAERAASAAGLLPQDTADLSPSEKSAAVAAVIELHGLDRSLASRVAIYVAGLATGDLGASWRDGTAVSSRVAPALATTLILIFLSLIIAVGAGIASAVLAAERPLSRRDAALSVASATAISIPLSWLGMLALRAIPVSGLGALPVLLLAVVPAAVIARHARASLLEALKKPWAVAARARGASIRRVVTVHALAASAPTLLSLVPALVGFMLGASLVVERVFGIRGLGWLITDASARGDAPVVVGVSVVAAAILGFASAAVDVFARAIDPRRLDSPQRARGDNA